jgi:membrane protein insertase Oxa1/YidC/SpoIIIJ
VSIDDIPDILFLKPLALIYNGVFTWILNIVPDPGWAILLFAAVLNVVLLPIYFQMENIGRKAKQSRALMNAEVARIKAHYKGRERYYYIKTLYRQFQYRPISVIFSSTDLYFQILIFATVYRFLADQDIFSGASFLFIRDLSRPDGALFSVNVLPILMTLFNVVSAMIYSKDKSNRKTAFLLAGVFAILLYSSPAALVLYWTFNNAVSLVRNLVAQKLIPSLPTGFTEMMSRTIKLD